MALSCVLRGFPPARRPGALPARRSQVCKQRQQRSAHGWCCCDAEVSCRAPARALPRLHGDRCCEVGEYGNALSGNSPIAQVSTFTLSCKNSSAVIPKFPGEALCNQVCKSYPVMPLWGERALSPSTDPRGQRCSDIQWCLS